MKDECQSSLFVCGQCKKPVELISMDYDLNNGKTTYVLRCHSKLETKTLRQEDLNEVKAHGKGAWLTAFDERVIQ